MVIDFLFHIEALCEAMVIDLFTSRPSARQWLLISYVTSRPSARQWSSISLHQDPLQSNGHLIFLCHIEALCEAMVIDLFTSRPSARQWSLISFLSISTLSLGLVSTFFQKVKKKKNFGSEPFTW